MRDFHKLEAHQVVLGKPLQWDIFDAAGNLLLRKGNLVKDKTQAEELVVRGLYVDSIEYEASLQNREPPYDPFYITQSVAANIDYLFANLPRDGSLQGEIETLAERLSWVAEHSPDASLAMIQLAEARRYPASHAVHTAILADMLAQRLAWDDDKRFSTLCAALSMNLAMHSLQQTLHSQREALSPEQAEVVNNHPTASARMLIECGVNDQEWLRAVLEHHERPDGCGYPRNARELSEISLLLHVCDVFCAMLSQRLYRPRLSGNIAIKEIYTIYTAAHGNPFGELLVREVGLYPPGTLVKLANGETGVVFKRGRTARSPQVLVLIDAKGMHCSKQILRDSGEEACAIAAVIPQEKSMLKVSLETIWQHGG